MSPDPTKRSERAKLEAEFRELLLAKIDDLNKKLDEQDKKLDEQAARMSKFEDVVKQLVLDMAVMQLKAGVWGAVGGLVTLLGGFLLRKLFGGGA